MPIVSVQLKESSEEAIAKIEERIGFKNRSLVIRVGILALTKLETEQIRELMFEQASEDRRL